MKQFLMAALPWVLAGIAVAIICAGLNKKETKDSEKKMERHIAVGAALGLILGVALNKCGLWENHALGFTVGPLWGMALATLQNHRDKDVKK